MPRFDLKNYFPLLAPAVALLLAIIGAYNAIDRKVTALAQAAMTPEKIEHLIDLKTEDRLDAIQASLTRIENNIERLQQAPSPR